MICGVDELIHFLLEQIALCSGLSYAEIETLVKEFYSRQCQQQPSSKPNYSIQEPLLPTVDDRLLGKIWHWLIENPEIHLEAAATKTHSSKNSATNLRDTPVRNAVTSNPGTDAAYASSAAENTTDSSPLTAEANTYSTAFPTASALDNNDTNVRLEYDGLVLQTSDRRIWQAIAGHDVDHARLPKAQFDLLRIIAAAGEQGILQPDLVKKSKQDRRSVPKRTDDLHKKHYIFKSSVRGKGDLTSLCTLRKFIGHVQIPDQTHDTTYPSSPKLRAETIPEGLVHKNDFLDSAMSIIKAAGIITFDEFRRRMEHLGAAADIDQKDNWLWQMELVGFIQRVQAKPGPSTKSKGTIKTLKFISDVTPNTRQAYMKFNHKDRHAIWLGNRDGILSKADTSSDPTEDEVAVTVPSLEMSTMSPDNLRRPTWQPQRPLENQLYDAIHHAGIDGIATIEIINKVTGSFAYRSIENFLRMLSNVWQESQPPHLRHLATVRDTSMEDGILHYRYWSHPNFALAVQKGLVSWEAVNEAYQSLPKARSGVLHKAPSEYLDEWDFPRILLPSQGSRDTKGTSSLKEISDQLKKESNAGILTILRKSGSLKKVFNYADLPEKVKRAPNELAPSKIFKVHTEYENRIWNHANFVMIREMLPAEETIPPETPPRTNSDEQQEKKSSNVQEVAANQTEIPLTYNLLAEEGNTNGSMVIKRSLPESTEDTSNAKRRKVGPARSEMLKVFDKHRKLKSRKEYIDLLTDEQRKALQHIYQELLYMSRSGAYVKPPQRLPMTLGRPRHSYLLVIKSNRLQDLQWFRNSSIEDKLNLKAISTYSIPPELGETILRPTSAEPIHPQRSQSATLDANEPSTQKSQPTPNTIGKLGPSLEIPLASVQEPQESWRNGSESLPQKRTEAADFTSPSPKRATISRVGSSSGIHARSNSEVDYSGAPLQDGQSAGTAQTVSFAEVPHKMTVKEMTLKRRLLKRGATTRAGVLLGGGSLAKQRSDMLVQIVKQAGGAHPGGSQIWLPFVTAAQKIDANWRPDTATVERAVRAVIASGKLKNLRFVFDSNKAIVEKSILCLPEFDMESDIVRVTENGIKESFPDTYIPNGVEVNPSLRPLQNAALILNEDIPTRRAGYILHPEIRIEKNVRRNENFEEDNSDEGSIDKEPRASSSHFQLGKHSHQSERVPRNRPRLSNKMRFDVDLVEPSPASNEAGFRFVVAPETYEAEHHEMLREQQTYLDELEPSSSTQSQHLDSTNPNGWIISWSKISTSSLSSRHTSASTRVENNWPNTKLRAALCTTLTDPDQEFRPASGTFTTEFAVIRDTRPKLRISTHMQREYEAKLPKSLLDIVQPPGKPGPKNSGKRPRRRLPQTFQTVVRAVQRWEQDNEELLAANSLIVPRFINYSTDEIELGRSQAPRDTLQLLQPSSSSDGPSNQRPQTVGPLARNSSLPNTVAVTKHFNTLPETSATPNPVSLDPFPLYRAESSDPPIDPQLYSRLRVTDLPLSHSSTQRPRDFANRVNLEQLRRTAVAMIVSRHLLGGVSEAVQWNVVSQALSEQNQGVLKSNCIQFCKQFPSYIEKLESWFPDAFLEAYERGDVPRIDYENIEEYDWENIIHWVLESQTIQSQGKAIWNEPVTSQSSDGRGGLKDRFQVEEEAEYHETSVHKTLIQPLTYLGRELAYNDLSFLLPLSTRKARTGSASANETDLATSFVRANILAPTSGYDKDGARHRLMSFEERILTAAVERLQNLKLITQKNKGRSVPGRNYCVTKSFHDSFTGNWSVEIFTSAVKYKHMLDQMFSERGHAEHSFQALDSHMLAIMDLHAAGRLEIQMKFPPITEDPSQLTIDPNTGERFISVWGFTEGNYKTVNMNFQNLTFPSRLVPTSKWINGIPLLDPLPPAPAPHIGGSEFASPEANEEKRIPIWFDIHDRFLPEMWELCVVAITTTLLMAPGASAQEISSLCRNAVFEWELLLLLKWMQQVGAVRSTSRANDRFKLCEWWWCILGDGSIAGE